MRKVIIIIGIILTIIFLILVALFIKQKYYEKKIIPKPKHKYLPDNYAPDEGKSIYENKIPKELINNNSECVKLGCPPDTKYVGSKRSDKYYSCSCRYAKLIKPENTRCFSSKIEAEEESYTYINC